MFIWILLIITSVRIDEVVNIRIRRDKTYNPHVFSSCYEEIGCVDFTEKWYHEKYRPQNLEPLDRHTIRTEFLLMKNLKNNANDLVYDVMAIKKDSIEVAGFKKGTCSIFIIHDFTSNGYTGWIKHLVVAFTKKTDCNIISVDWEAGAEPPFLQAISNARVVALEAKLFINTLTQCFGQLTDNLHLVGHGVGAHIAGYIGKYIPGVQRITALDPTGTYFAHMPKEVRLDVADAKYVEVLHTDSFNHRSQGTKISLGHADFIINNADHQPGCNDSSHYPSFVDLHRDTLQEGKILPACSHKRSFKYYIQALEDDECQFIGIHCKNYESFTGGKCNECGNKGGCATFGLEPPSVNTKNNTFYMLTNGRKPYCMVTYSVNITIYASNTTSREVEGYFEFILVDEKDRVTNASSNPYNKVIRKFDSGKTYRFVFYALPPIIHKVKEAKVKWMYKSKKICILCDKSILVQDIGIRRLTLKADSSSSTSYICPMKKGDEIKTGDYVEFLPCETLYGPNYVKNGRKQVPPDRTSGSNQTSQAMENNSSLNSSIVDVNSNISCESLNETTVAPVQPRLAQSTPLHSSSIQCGSNSTLNSTTNSHNTSEASSTTCNATRTTPTTPLNSPDHKSGKETQDEQDVKAFKDCFDSDRTTTTESCTLDKKSAPAYRILPKGKFVKIVT